MYAKSSFVVLLGMGCTAGKDSAMPSTRPAATMETLTSFSCDDPQLRSTDGPMQQGSLGADWDAQMVADNLPWQYTGGGAAVADFNGDGILDVYLPSAEDSMLLLSDGSTWQDAAASLPATERDDLGIGGIAFDADDDGDMDIYTLVLHGQNRLLINDGTGTFTDGTAAAGLLSGAWDTMHAAAVDANGDGALDLLVANHNEGPHLGKALLGGSFPPAHENRLFVGDGAGGFVDETDSLPDDFRLGYSFSVYPEDLDLDGQDELLGVNDFGPQTIPNTVMSLEGDTWSLTEQFDGLNVEIYGMGITSGDLNADAVPDVVMSSWGELVLLESTTESIWYRSATARGLLMNDQQSTAWGVVLADMDNDGDQDLSVGMGPLVMPAEFAKQIEDSNPGLQTFSDQPDALFLQGTDGTFIDVAAQWGVDHTGISRGVLAVDINRDGWLDLLRRGVDGPAVLYQARCGDGAGLIVSLNQPPPNRNAIGAHVTVLTPEHTLQRRMRAGGEGHAMGGPPEVHFGLSSADQISLQVTWPDGSTDTFEDISPGHVRITRQ